MGSTSISSSRRSQLRSMRSGPRRWAPSSSVRLELGLPLARGTLGIRGCLERAIGRLQVRAGALGRASQLVDDAAAGLLRCVESLELALQRLERLHGRGVALLGDARLVLALGETKPHVGDGFLVTPACLARGE